MLGHLQGFLSVLDILAEGGRRHAELIAGREFTPGLRLQPVAAPAREKTPLTRHQISRLFDSRPKSRVSIEH
ncbi:MAG: hypothetical protein HW417_551 [Steroidobacteraceae bacterium]|nr:hypothetical protein [Steroidobacteraceae bacterium]MBM2853623.1 hypothetical protein [Steroidobacteraceae bacterium]